MYSHKYLDFVSTFCPLLSKVTWVDSSFPSHLYSHHWSLFILSIITKPFNLEKLFHVENVKLAFDHHWVFISSSLIHKIMNNQIKDTPTAEYCLLQGDITWIQNSQAPAASFSHLRWKVERRQEGWSKVCVNVWVCCGEITWSVCWNAAAQITKEPEAKEVRSYCLFFKITTWLWH